MSIFKTLVGFSLITWISIASSSPDSPPSAYEMLEKFNFPKGILPVGVKGYNLNEDGRFEVFLNGDCEFKIEEGGYILYYKKKITGKVGFGSLTELYGIKVKVLFVWIGITEVRNRGENELEFYVGMFSASFPVANFEESPECDCGTNRVEMVSDS